MFASSGRASRYPHFRLGRPSQSRGPGARIRGGLKIGCDSRMERDTPTEDKAATNRPTTKDSHNGLERGKNLVSAKTALSEVCVLLAFLLILFPLHPKFPSPRLLPVFQFLAACSMELLFFESDSPTISWFRTADAKAGSHCTMQSLTALASMVGAPSYKLYPEAANKLQE